MLNLKKLKIHWILSLMFLWLSACEKKENPLRDLPENKTFRFIIATEPPSLDWNKITDLTSNIIVSNIMEGLLDYDFSQNKINYKPALARSIESQNNGQTWILTLREDVYWTDGVPFQPQHVLDSWERVLNPKTASLYAYFLYSIKNAKEYNTGKIKDFSKVGVKITSDRKIKVELTGSKYFFPFTLTHSTTYPIRTDIIQKYGPKWTEPENIVTLGPYILTRWDHDKLLILKKNPSYYNTFPGNAENVTIKIIPEISTTLNLFDSGLLDVLDALPSKQMSVLKKRPEYKSFPSLTTQYYGFNTTQPPLDNVKFRQAIAMAVDKTQIEKLMDGQAMALNSWIPPGIFGTNPNIGISFNPEKARQFLNEVGDRADLPKITISFNTNEGHKRIAENIQAQLKKNLSLNVEIKNEEWKTYLKNLENIRENPPPPAKSLSIEWGGCRITLIRTPI